MESVAGTWVSTGKTWLKKTVRPAGSKIKLVRITTIPLSLRMLITGQPEYMQQQGFEVTLISSPGADWELMPGLPQVKHHKVDMARRINILKDIRALIALIRLFRQIRPDIVHSHTPKAGLLAMIAAAWCGVPVRLHTLAGMPAMTARGFTRFVLLQAERLTYRFAHEVWVNSKKMLQFILDRKLISPAKATMILNGSSNGVDLTRYNRKALDADRLNSLIRRYDIQVDEFIFLAVGRMVNDKGIRELVAAFERVHAGFPRARLFLLGPFEQSDALPEEVVHTIRQHRSITHINWSDEVQYFMAFANCFIHASYREGFPNVLLQAGAMMCPVICSDIPGNTDIVEDASEGLVVPVRDADALATAMEAVINDYPLALTRAGVLHRKVLTQYDRRVFHEAIKERYKLLLTQKKYDVSAIR